MSSSAASKGLTPFDRAAHEPITVTDFQGTHYSATRLWNVENDEITYHPLDSLMTIYKNHGRGRLRAGNDGKHRECAEV